MIQVVFKVFPKSTNCVFLPAQSFIFRLRRGHLQWLSFSHRHLLPRQASDGECRSKMRMSGLCKVEMSGFIQGGRRDGTGANRVEHEGTGSVEGAARSRARPSETGGSGAASAIERPAGPAPAGPAASGRRCAELAMAAP